MLGALKIEMSELKLFFEPKDRLRLTVGEEKSYPTVKPVWSAPLSQPAKFLALLDAKGEEIAMLEDPATLSADSLQAVKEELSRRYLTSTVHVVSDARTEFGSTYWHVITERGERDFVTQSLQENAQWLSPTHLMLIDVDGNRFEIPNTKNLDPKSADFIQRIL
jgi:hypothetical protein